jgi:hypothetical protein
VSLELLLSLADLLCCNTRFPFSVIFPIFSFLGEITSPSDLLILFFPTGMEDAHAVSLNLDEPQGDVNPNTFFAVYDGHGGTLLTLHLPSLLRS